ncbi:MAG: hypothetical protein RL151_816 [Bacteroidota bacterium]
MPFKYSFLVASQLLKGGIHWTPIPFQSPGYKNLNAP